MKLPKNSVSLILICSSIALLLVLQALWLRKEYADQETAFHRQTHGMLRNVVFELTDSLILKGIKPMDQKLATWDSAGIGRLRVGKISRDSAHIFQIFVSSTISADTLPDMIRPIVSRVRSGESLRRFVVNFPSDSVSLAQIHERFSRELKTDGIDLPFMITKNAATFHGRTLSNEPVLTPSGRYELAFVGLPNFLFMKILPQILFSLFLTGLTIASFALMFRSLRMQQRLVEIKNGFIGNITHELKTPITTVGVALEALRNFQGLRDPQKTEEYLTIAESELKRLSLLTDKVLKSALFESSATQFQFEKIDLANVVDQVTQSMKLVIEKHAVSVTLEKVGRDFGVEGDRDHLINVFFNLIDNSIKYGRPPIKIEMHLNADPDKVAITVTDNGIGIPKSHQQKVFEKFYRVPTGDVHNSKGHGLGLSYVDAVVKGHGGSIAVQSDEGQGCSFTITLPRTHNEG
ncbi:MAG: sensor histidine kinase [Cyclobacteriaceae bacterium]